MRSPVIGYVFDRDGKYQYKWMFEGTMKNMASFIMTHVDSDTMITDMGDRPLVTSMRGGWLDRVCNSEFRKELMRELEPLQNYIKEPEKLEFEQDGGYMIQKNVREASIMTGGQEFERSYGYYVCISEFNKFLKGFDFQDTEILRAIKHRCYVMQRQEHL